MTAKEYQLRYGNGKPDQVQGTPGKERPRAQIRIPKKRTPNKTEREFLEIAARLHPDCTIYYEPFTLHLPSLTKYKPDVVAIHPLGQIMRIYETKGPHIHNQRSIHAFKEAITAFPFWEFTFAQKTRAGWAYEHSNTERTGGTFGAVAG